MYDLVFHRIITSLRIKFQVPAVDRAFARLIHSCVKGTLLGACSVTQVKHP